MSVRSRKQFCWMTKWVALAIALVTMVSGPEAAAQGGGGGGGGFNFGFNRVVGGVAVDAQGVLANSAVRLPAAELQALQTRLQQADPGIARPGYRAVSLKAIEAALQQAAQGGPAISPELQFMAGLTRIEYVVARPDAQDVLLIGPGEAWTADPTGRVVGANSGQPILLLEDFLVAMRTVENATQDYGISVDIRPSEEGVRNGAKVTQQAAQQRRFDSAVQTAIEEATGMQTISLTGVPHDSHFGHVLIAADYRMKRLSMGFESAPIAKFPSLLEMIQQKGGLTGSINPRFWMECNYDAIAKSEDGLSWKIQGQGVKTLTEETYYDKAGQVVTKKKAKSNPLAEKWAATMTERFDELRKADPVFAELRNVMDLSVVAALIAKEQLLTTAQVSAPELTQLSSAFTTPVWLNPTNVPSKCSFIRNIDASVTVSTSGGVQVDSWGVASRQKVDPQLQQEVAKLLDGATFQNTLFANIGN